MGEEKIKIEGKRREEMNKEEKSGERKERRRDESR